MGVAPGVKTEFWEYKNMDFCGDLASWTNALLSTDDAPIVHSVSYGWQGNLTQIHCDDTNVKVVDANFAKLAAKGVSIMISSGDSGSGYTAPHCTTDSGVKGEEITGGTKIETLNEELLECCDFASERGAKGFTWVPPPKSSTTTAAAVALSKRAKRREAGHNRRIDSAIEHGRDDAHASSPASLNRRAWSR